VAGPDKAGGLLLRITACGAAISNEQTDANDGVISPEKAFMPHTAFNTAS